MELTIAVSERIPVVVAPQQKRRQLSLRLAKRVQTLVSKCAEGKLILAGGIEVSAGDVAAADFLLPMMLLAISEVVGHSVVTGENQSAFSFRMKASPVAVLCFEVTHIETPSLRAISRAVMDIMQRSEVDGVFNLDDHILRYTSFLENNGVDFFDFPDKDVGRTNVVASGRPTESDNATLPHSAESDNDSIAVRKILQLVRMVAEHDLGAEPTHEQVLGWLVQKAGIADAISALENGPAQK
jgi:hypothetical protein